MNPRPPFVAALAGASGIVLAAAIMGNLLPIIPWLLGWVASLSGRNKP